VSDSFVLLLVLIILIFSEPLCAEYSDEELSGGPNEDSRRGDDLDDDNEEAEPKSKVLAHVELARSVREFGPVTVGVWF
jgi:hypothetical protein